MSRRRKRLVSFLYVFLGVVLTILAIFLVSILVAQNNIDKQVKYQQEHNLKLRGSYAVDEVIDNFREYVEKLFTVEGIVAEIRDDGNFYLVDVAYQDEIKNNSNYKLDYNRTIKIHLTNRLSELPNFSKGDRLAVRGGFGALQWNLEKVYYSYEMIAESIRKLDE